MKCRNYKFGVLNVFETWKKQIYSFLISSCFHSLDPVTPTENWGVQSSIKTSRHCILLHHCLTQWDAKNYYIALMPKFHYEKKCFANLDPWEHSCSEPKLKSQIWTSKTPNILYGWRLSYFKLISQSRLFNMFCLLLFRLFLFLLRYSTNSHTFANAKGQQLTSYKAEIDEASSGYFLE